MENNLTEIKKGIALKAIQRQDALVFFKREDIECQDIFIPETTIMETKEEDFHNISGKFQPKGYKTDQIGEANGILFTENCGVRIETVNGNPVWVGFAQGKKRLPDGTWKTSTINEYEWDPKSRAEEDCLKKSRSEQQRRLLELQYQKIARSRASTGARLRVIRELVGMPVAFEHNQIKNNMIFCRIAVNTQALLSSPETRQAAINHALGVTNQIYQPKKVEMLEPPQDENESQDIDFSIDTTEPEINPELDEIRFKLIEWAESGSLSQNNTNQIYDMVNAENPDIEKMKETLNKILEAKRGK